MLATQRNPLGNLEMMLLSRLHHKLIELTPLGVEPRHLHFLLQCLSFDSGEWPELRTLKMGDVTTSQSTSCALGFPVHPRSPRQQDQDSHPGQSEFKSCVLPSPTHCFLLGQSLHGMKSGPDYQLPCAGPLVSRVEVPGCGLPSPALGTLYRVGTKKKLMLIDSGSQ